MADLGHDVYITNNRGNKISTGHVELDSEVDEEYWHFGLESLSLDVLASAEKMIEHAGTGKGWYFGFS